MAGTAASACHGCGEPVGASDSFCESCGAELAPPAVSDGGSGGPQTCESCSGRISADGYCESCGRRGRSGRDHEEVDLGMAAGVTDRGLRRSRNEDAMALATAGTADGPVVVAVVCDGVSSSARPDEASLAAARAAADVLLTAVRGGRDLAAAAPAAVRAAAEAVAGLGQTAGPLADPPSSTFVSAVLTSEAAIVCWLGDSRAYWLATGPDAAAQQLTTDDSVAQELVAAGLLSETDALASAQGHVVTRWIGADLTNPEPHVMRFEPPGPGVLLLCSDGLWNYQPAADKLADLALPAALTDPLGAARTLTSFALDAGGMDNVTVVLAPFPVSADPMPRRRQP